MFFSKIIASLVLLVFLAGCSQHQGNSLPQQPVCGNNVPELGEECEAGVPCPGDQVCTASCKCENLSPPAFPE